ncbi:uncharacterized protein FIESC28_05898 [Fusarium coffeatum]|uniref:Uncharacterized protein n=1 Tax=Fusarium coffeatum TaxID=231269 RepID=A0A366RNR9_9HYPO|nr:uncharacterized protein FIESC28_05898 [Fusarium coffeatum]RBR18757.1 hypothetical protein FIESC28_05898 [Fusarium coffeatum]
MSFPWCLPWPQQSYWDEFNLNGLKIKVKTSSSSLEKTDTALTDGPSNSTSLEPYFWGKGFRARGIGRLLSSKNKHPVHIGYAEARGLIGRGTVDDLQRLSHLASTFVIEVFEDIDEFSGASSSEDSVPSSRVTQLKLSPELEEWKTSQHAIGNVLPPKGAGLSPVSDEILHILGAEHWPEALKTTNALFGCGIASLLMGAADSNTMFSNYVTDMAFYYEHGYNYVFPNLEPLLEKGLNDPHALKTPGGQQRRDAVAIGKRYIQGKIALEKKHKDHLLNRSARLDRRTAQIVSLSESSLLGMAAEATARGFDAGAVMADLVFSSPGTDVVDVGCDLVNSEVMNSFLNVSDITDTGIVSEDVLRKVYDAYAVMGARMLTQRWHEPVARMCAALYTWHIQNDRHMFFRRALLGWQKARKTPAQPQSEGDFDEVFDKTFHLTGFSRPLDAKYTCNGEDTCDRVHDHLNRHSDEPLLKELWWYLVTGPLEYVRGGQVSEKTELDLAEGSRLRMAKLFSKGKVLEMVWLIAHANHHAWQVNYLFEAAMFGSILDGGKLIGKLDRKEQF